MSVKKILGIGPVVAGSIIGILASLLVYFGNPGNMGVCVACFQRDIAGSLGLHRASVVQYLRPEIIGFVLGAFIASMIFREFRARTGSAPVVRFLLGMFAMIGSLVFLGCPWRALLRLAGGDLNALLGLAGLASGIFIGILFLKRGYNLGRTYRAPAVAGILMPAVMLILLVLFILFPSFGEGKGFFISEHGPGSLHAPLLISLGAGILVGILAQRSRFCTVGALRDRILTGDSHLLKGIIALLTAAFLTNLFLTLITDGTYLRFSFIGQPVSHSNFLWNFMGMLLAGLAFTLAGGCPGRQLFMSGEGDGDAAVFVFGMLGGAALAHNFGLAAVPDRMLESGALQVGGPSINGICAVFLGLVFCLVIGLFAGKTGERNGR